MIKNPIVSVIIPVYNGGEFINKAVESVLKQTYRDFEIIIINDGSTDNTEVIVKQFNDIRIRYICHEKNLGLSKARNTGIRTCRGKYIAFLDADDEYLPEKLALQVKRFENISSEVGVVCAWSFNMDQYGKIFSKRFLPKKEGYVFELLLSANPMSVPTLLIRKECFEKVGLFDSELDGQEDWDMWMRITKYYKISLIKMPLAKRRIHPNRMSDQFDRKVMTAQRIIEKHMGELKKRRRIYSRHYFYIGRRYCFMGKTVIARKFISKAISLYPFYHYYYILFILSFLGPMGFLALLKLIRSLKHGIIKLANGKIK